VTSYTVVKGLKHKSSCYNLLMTHENTSDKECLARSFEKQQTIDDFPACQFTYNDLLRNCVKRHSATVSLPTAIIIFVTNNYVGSKEKLSLYVMVKWK
jgi:hypothetical protein